MAEWNRSKKLEILGQWAQNEGIKMHCEIKTGDSADGAGVYAVADAAAGETLVDLPASSVLTRVTVIDHAKTHPFLTNLLYRNVKGEEFSGNESLEGISDKDVLTRFFIYEILTSRRGDAPDSDKWLTWVQSLPPVAEMNLPISWDRQDLEDLVGTSIYEATLSKINFLKFRYKKFFESETVRNLVADYVKAGSKPDLTMETNTEITFKDWVLIESWIASRSLEVVDTATAESDQKSLCLGLVPIVDMCNHSYASNAKYELDPETCAVSLVATKPISKGEQVFISYGDEKGSGEMLFSYGFLPSSNVPNARDATFTIPDLIGEDEQTEDEESIVLKAKDRMFGARPRLFKVVQLHPDQSVSWSSDYITFLALPPADFSFATNAGSSDDDADAPQVVLFRGLEIDFDDLNTSIGNVLEADKDVRDKANYMAESLVRDVFLADLTDEEGQQLHGQSPHPLVLLERKLLSAVKFS